MQHTQRVALQKQLGEAGIGSLIHYPIPPHLQQAYASANYVKGQFPIAERIANHCLSLPMGPQMPDEAVETVIKHLYTPNA